ncbi:hypothetical protein [Palleronia caenipelagi]|uniref:hypothetical protein n=1 Tax=Palleronia caenipelagi TaxID=2489174 RepID=UPI00163D62C2|nr:hypothetical protein [Palleronia caenipelagi]
MSIERGNKRGKWLAFAVLATAAAAILAGTLVVQSPRGEVTIEADTAEGAGD